MKQYSFVYEKTQEIVTVNATNFTVAKCKACRYWQEYRGIDINPAELKAVKNP